jgi:hypothetical protein
MAKATFKLQTGALVTIEGTTEEIKSLLGFYENSYINQKKDEKTIEERNVTVINLLGKKAKPEETDIVEIINLAKTRDDADAIEHNILLQTNEANRALLPLFIVHENFNNAFGLTTTEIGKITIELGPKVSRQNALRALKFSATGFVTKQGYPPRYTLNKQGVSHIKKVLSGEATPQASAIEQSLSPTPRKGRRSRSKSYPGKKGQMH